ncbi:hypothetical protein [Ktedonospora formicarum]|uniref:hypothetical protein n=1 Tax=Ktedonospora formicarum TaxID=2778364 RepID=UPI001C68F070|nr:hypothetical protein [Ktedonospora formicarum]
MIAIPAFRTWKRLEKQTSVLNLCQDLLTPRVFSDTIAKRCAEPLKNTGLK